MSKTWLNNSVTRFTYCMKTSPVALLTICNNYLRFGQETFSIGEFKIDLKN